MEIMQILAKQVEIKIEITHLTELILLIKIKIKVKSCNKLMVDYIL
jgi:hypothetical protein